jgi:dolichol-phosphate mannosyltransferase
MTGIAIVPTYDETEGIVAMLDAVLFAAPDVDVLVVGDDSPDGTARLVIAHPGYRWRWCELAHPGESAVSGFDRAGQSRAHFPIEAT